jgi:hypothetical protein
MRGSKTTELLYKNVKGIKALFFVVSGETSEGQEFWKND